MRDVDLPVLATDSRRLEVIVDGLPLFGGCQLAVDTTVCVRRIAMAPLMTVHPTGTVRLPEEERNVVIQRWWVSESGRRVVLAVAVGGRWSAGTSSFLAQLAKTKARPGVSHDSPRAQTCTFQCPGFQKHHQNSTRRHPERQKKNEKGLEREKKKSEILGGPAEGGLAQGGPGKSKPTTTTTTTTTTTPTPPEMEPKGGPKGSGLGFRSECRSLGLWCLGFLGSIKIGQNTKTQKLAKVGLAKVGHDR